MLSAPAFANVRDLALGALDHQVDVDQRAGGVDLLGERVDRERAHRDRRHEVAVHDVDVDHARAGVEHLADLLAQAREVGGQDRGGDAGQLGHNGLEHRAPAVVAGVQRGVGHAHDRRVLAAVGAHGAELEAAAGSSRSGSGRELRRAQPRLMAGRADGPRSTSGSVTSRAPPQASDEEALRAVAVRQRLEVAGHTWMLPDGDRLAQVVRLESGVFGQERRHDALVLAGRDRAGRVDERAAGAHGGRARRAGSRPGCARAARAGRRSCASARRAGWRACRGPSRAGRRARGRRPPARARRRRRPRAPRRSVAPIRCAVRASAAARPRWRSTATTAPRSSISAARWVVLPPGRGAEVEHALARLRVEQPRDHHRRARLRHEQRPRATRARRGRRRAPRARAPPAGRGAGWLATGSRRRARRRSVRSVLARSAGSAGSLSAAISARAPSGPSVSHHSSAIHSGCEWRSAAACGVSSGSASTAPRRLAGGAAQDRVDEPGAAARVLLGELHRLAHRGVGRHAVEVGELEDPEPQRGRARRVEAVDVAPGERRDHVVERGAALDGAVGQAGGEAEVARVEAEPLRLAAQRAIGPGVILEDPAQDRVGAPPGGGDGRGGAANFVYGHPNKRPASAQRLIPRCATLPT